MQATFIIAQLLGVASGVFYLISGRQKEHKQIMLYQILDCFAVIASNLLLGATVGAVVCVIALLRNILSYCGRLNKVSIAVIILSNLVINYGFNGIHNWADLVMPLNSIIYTVGVYFSTGRTTKKFMLLDVTVWICYDVYTKNIGLLIFNVVALVSTTQSLLHDKEELKKDTAAMDAH